MLFPLILVIATIGCYGLNGTMFDVHVMLVFGIVGYLFGRLDVPIAPVVLGLVLGKMMEQSFRQAMTISDGSLRIFVGSNIAVTLLVACCTAMAAPGGRRAAGAAAACRTPGCLTTAPGEWWWRRCTGRRAA